MICIYYLRLFTVPCYFVRWSGSNVDLVMHVTLKKPNGFFVFVIFYVSSNILQDVLLLYDFSISNLFPITLVKQLIEKWISRFHFLHEIEFANKKNPFRWIVHYTFWPTRLWLRVDSDEKLNLTNVLTRLLYIII